MSSTVDTKRKREDETADEVAADGARPSEDSNEAKKHKPEDSSPLEAVASASSDVYEQVSGSGPAPLAGRGKGTPEDPHVIYIAPDKVGHVIGSKGAVIADMQKLTGAKIYVDQTNVGPGQDRKVNITGTPEQVEKAVELVSKVVAYGPTSIHANSLLGGPSVDRLVECPHAIVGKIIGTKGDIIKDIQQRSGAKLQVHQENLKDGEPRQIQISGNQVAVDTALGLVNLIMSGGSLPPVQGGGYHGNKNFMAQPAHQPHRPGFIPAVPAEVAPGTFKIVMEIQRSDVGRVIGKKGENVSKIGQTCGCKIQIVQDVIPCRAEITGPLNNIQRAEGMIFDIISNPDPHAFISGGRPPQAHMGGGGYMAPNMMHMMNPYMGMNMNMAYGMHFMQQQQQPQQVPAVGYGMYNAAPAMPAAPVAAASSAWAEYKSEDGTPYYHNKETGVTQWEKPPGFKN